MPSKPISKPDVVRLLYTITEGAKALGCSTATMHRAISHKLIAAVPLGRVLRISATEIERVAREGLGPIPHNAPRYLRKTTGPTKRGRPRTERRRGEHRPAS